MFTDAVNTDDPAEFVLRGTSLSASLLKQLRPKLRKIRKQETQQQQGEKLQQRLVEEREAVVKELVNIEVAYPELREQLLREERS